MAQVNTRAAEVVRFRHHPGRGAAGIIVTISLITLAGVSPWLGLVALLPLAWTVWVWRAGTDADPTGVWVRALLGKRHFPWSRVRDLAVRDRGRVVATLTDGAQAPLTAVTAQDLPHLVAVAGPDRHRS
jgi:hypothetical protein